MTLDIYTDKSHRTLLMQLSKDERGNVVIALMEPLNRVVFLKRDLEMVKQFLEME